MLLTTDCKKVLNVINKLNAKNKSVDTLEIIFSFPKWKQKSIADKIEDILFFLSDNEYITYMSYDDSFDEIKTTYKGLAYKAFRYEEVKEFIFKSILIPIVVALVTAILTTYIYLALQLPM